MNFNSRIEAIRFMVQTFGASLSVGHHFTNAVLALRDQEVSTLKLEIETLKEENDRLKRSARIQHIENVRTLNQTFDF